MKRLGITGAVLVAVFALSGLVGSATASAAFQCLLVSNPVAGGGLNGKEGAYETKECKTPTPHLLEGKWIEAEPLVKTLEDLWCALINLELPGKISGEDGYYKNSTCTEKNTKANASDYTEVIVPSSGESTKILPEPTAGAPLSTTGSQPAEGHILTTGGLEVKCKKASGSETFTSANGGKGEVLFTECKGPLSTVCTGEGDPEGLIAVKGEVFFWLALMMTGTKEKPTSELIGALVFLLSPEVKLTCVNKSKTIEDKIVVKGCVASQVLPASLNKLISEAKEQFTEWSSGETSVLSVLKSEATSETACLPTTSTNGGAAELSALTGLFNVSKFTKGGKEITIELMNP